MLYVSIVREHPVACEPCAIDQNVKNDTHTNTFFKVVLLTIDLKIQGHKICLLIRGILGTRCNRFACRLWCFQGQGIHWVEHTYIKHWELSYSWSWSSCWHTMYTQYSLMIYDMITCWIHGMILNLSVILFFCRCTFEFLKKRSRFLCHIKHELQHTAGDINDHSTTGIKHKYIGSSSIWKSPARLAKSKLFSASLEQFWSAAV